MNVIIVVFILFGFVLQGSYGSTRLEYNEAEAIEKEFDDEITIIRPSTEINKSRLEYQQGEKSSNRKKKESNKIYKEFDMTVSWQTYIQKLMGIIGAVFAGFWYFSFFQIPGWYRYFKKKANLFIYQTLPTACQNAILFAGFIGFAQGCSDSYKPLNLLFGYSTALGFPGFMMPCLTGILFVTISIITACQGPLNGVAVNKEDVKPAPSVHSYPLLLDHQCSRLIIFLFIFVTIMLIESSYIRNYDDGNRGGHYGFNHIL